MLKLKSAIACLILAVVLCISVNVVQANGVEGVSVEPLYIRPVLKPQNSNPRFTMLNALAHRAAILGCK